VKFPIVLKTSADASSDAEIYYVVASNGLFQVRKTECYEAVTRVTGTVPGLCPQEEYVEIDFPKLPRALVRKVLTFFRAVYERYGGEAIVILFYQPQTRTFRAVAPAQQIPGYWTWDGRWRAVLRLSYREPERPAGYLRFGTIHSHAEFPAYSSPTDCADEHYGDGLHLVFGHLNRAEPSREASFVANSARFALDADDVLPGCDVPQGTPDAGWMARVCRIESRAGSGNRTDSWYTAHGCS
jgi:hypothetical protein